MESLVYQVLSLNMIKIVENRHHKGENRHHPFSYYSGTFRYLQWTEGITKERKSYHKGKEKLSKSYHKERKSYQKVIMRKEKRRGIVGRRLAVDLSMPVRFCLKKIKGVGGRG